MRTTTQLRHLVTRPEIVRDLLNRVLAGGHPVRVVYGRGGWVNVNDVAGLVDASGL